MGDFDLKHLPLTLVGPINATRPVLVLGGAMLIFGERLNAWQWTGVHTARNGVHMDGNGKMIIFVPLIYNKLWK